MSPSISIASRLKKFLFLYILGLSLVVFVMFLAFNTYVDYLSSVIKDLARNPVMIHDTFTLKQNLVPLIKGNILEIKVFNSSGEIVFEHDQSEQTFFVVFKNYEIFEKENILYKISLKIDLKKYLIIIFLISISMLFGFYPFVRYEEKEFQNKSNQLIANLSKKVAHDIRTPISTLNLISSKIADQDIKKLQQAVVNQINLIAEDLLNTSNQKVVSSLTRQTYLEFFEQIQQEYDLKQNFRTILVFNIDKEVSKYIIIYAKVLYPIICNVINNSIEACHIDNGEIEISARLLGNQFYIKIRDNGKGIPSEILSLLGRKQISYGKSNSSRSGNGIALFNARKDIESINGRFEIRSTLNEFTEVEIYIPLT